MTRYTLFKLAMFLAKRLPRPALYSAARVIARVGYHVNREKSEAAKANLRVMLGADTPEKRLKALVMEAGTHLGKNLAEFFGLQRFGGTFIDRHVSAVGREHIDRAVAAGRGAVMPTPHLSNWEIAAAAASREGYAITVIGWMNPNPAMNAMLLRQRRTRGYDVLPRESAFRHAVNALRENKLVCLGSDRNVGGGGVEVEFFGRPTLFPHGPARFALAADSVVLPSFVVRQPDNDFVIHVEPPIPVPARGNRKTKAQEMTQHFATLVEEYARRYPAQWCPFFRFWPDDPEGELAGGFTWGPRIRRDPGTSPTDRPRAKARAAGRRERGRASKKLEPGN